MKSGSGTRVLERKDTIFSDPSRRTENNLSVLRTADASGLRGGLGDQSSPFSLNTASSSVGSAFLLRGRANVFFCSCQQQGRLYKPDNRKLS